MSDLGPESNVYNIQEILLKFLLLFKYRSRINAWKKLDRSSCVSSTVFI